MYFQRPTAGGVVSKIASSDDGASTANKLVDVSGVSGAGAKARSNALVSVRVLTRLTNTTTLRLDLFFFTSVSHPEEPAILGRVSDNTMRIPYVHIIDRAGGGLARILDFPLKWRGSRARCGRRARGQSLQPSHSVETNTV